MLNGPPKTLKDARKHRYHQWAGNPKGWSYNEGYCAYEVGDLIGYQCSRKNGHGPAGLYCKQHAGMIKKMEGGE